MLNRNRLAAYLRGCWRDALFISGLILLQSVIFTQNRPIEASDPDRYLHLALARQAAESPTLHRLPQADNTAFKDHYPDVYFLFRWVSGRLYRWGGEAAVERIPSILGPAVLAAVYVGARTYLAPPPAFLITAAMAMAPYCMNRLTLLRPLQIALLAFCLMLIAIIRESVWGLAASALLFGLSYTAYYVPLAVLVLLALVRGGKGRAALWLPAAGLAGLAAAMVLHPDFPANLLMALNTAGAAVNSSQLSASLMPIENIGITLPVLVRDFGPLPLTLIILIYLAFAKKEEERKSTAPSSDPWLNGMLVIISLGFWWLTFWSLRAAEYALPSTAITVAALCATAFPRANRKLWLAPALMLAGMLPIGVHALLTVQPMIDLATRWSPIDALHEAPAGAKVLNCEWYTSPFILYRRPDLRFVDLSDPGVLANRSPELFDLREMFRAGIVPYPYGVARFAFGADYVLCEHPAAIEQLSSDPHFERLYPEVLKPFAERPRGFLALFKVLPHPLPNDFFSFEGAALSATPTRLDVLSPETQTDAAWESIGGQHFVVQSEARSPYLQLQAWLAQHKPDRAVSSQGSEPCVLVRPSAEELARHLGAEWLAVGGGPRVALFLNGKYLTSFHNQPGIAPRAIERFARLPHRLQARDKVIGLVCEAPYERRTGFALSAWSEEDRRARPYLESFRANRSR